MMTLRLRLSGKVFPIRPSFRSRVPPTSRHKISTMPRPYRFHVCANWLAAPPDHGLKKRSTPFATSTVVGTWRDHVLTWPRPGFSKTPGEDFFYVQEVCMCARKLVRGVTEPVFVRRCEISRWVSSVIYLGDLHTHVVARLVRAFRSGLPTASGAGR